MLLDDEEKTVELLVENIIWGNVHFNNDSINSSDAEFMQDFIENAGEWYAIRQKLSDPDMYVELKSRFDELTKKLHSSFVAGRLSGIIQGELKDRDAYQKIRTLEEDNQKLAEQLSKAYIPSTDVKIGTT